MPLNKETKAISTKWNTNSLTQFWTWVNMFMSNYKVHLKKKKKKKKKKNVGI